MAKICLNSHPLEKGIEIASKTLVRERHSALAFGDALKYAGYRDVPVSWFFCEEDQCISPAVQQVCTSNLGDGS